MFADTITASMKRAIDETNRRRQIQMEYNEKNGIVPKTIIKEIKNTLEFSKKQIAPVKDVSKEIERLKGLMQIASKQLDFETAIELRDRIAILKKELNKK